VNVFLITFFQKKVMPARQGHDFWQNGQSFLQLRKFSYLTLKPKDFHPPSPFTLSEFEDLIPNRVYNKEELLKYCDFCKTKCKDLLLSLNEEILEQKWVNESDTMNFSVFEILLYNLRHVQHHVGQLNLLLRQNNLQAPDWEYREEDI
jgi:uncharacterized damage-inducible protein DinB